MISPWIHDKTLNWYTGMMSWCGYGHKIEIIFLDDIWFAISFAFSTQYFDNEDFCQLDLFPNNLFTASESERFSIHFNPKS